MRKVLEALHGLSAPAPSWRTDAKSWGWKVNAPENDVDYVLAWSETGVNTPVVPAEAWRWHVGVGQPLIDFI